LVAIIAWEGRGRLRLLDRVALVCWCLWKHQNDIVFEGAPSPLAVLRNIRREAELWKAAGLFKAELTTVDRWRLGE
jgi:hypothetical protein